MQSDRQDEILNPRKTLYYENGRLYFTKTAERRVFFLLTFIMLLIGVLYKSGLF